MITPEELSTILDRVVDRKQTEADILALRQVLSDVISGATSDPHQFVIQISKDNVNVGEGKEIGIGDRTLINNYRENN